MNCLPDNVPTVGEVQSDDAVDARPPRGIFSVSRTTFKILICAFFCVEVAEAEVSGGREESTENTLTAVTAPSSRDIGHLIVKSKESALTDNDREEALKNRWSPMTIEDCPYSFQNQKGKVWKRRLGISFFPERFCGLQGVVGCE